MRLSLAPLTPKPPTDVRLRLRFHPPRVANRSSAEQDVIDGWLTLLERMRNGKESTDLVVPALSNVPDNSLAECGFDAEEVLLQNVGGVTCG